MPPVRPRLDGAVSDTLAVVDSSFYAEQAGAPAIRPYSRLLFTCPS